MSSKNELRIDHFCIPNILLHTLILVHKKDKHYKNENWWPILKPIFQSNLITIIYMSSGDKLVTFRSIRSIFRVGWQTNDKRWALDICTQIDMMWDGNHWTCLDFGTVFLAQIFYVRIQTDAAIVTKNFNWNLLLLEQRGGIE